MSLLFHSSETMIELALTSSLALVSARKSDPWHLSRGPKLGILVDDGIWGVGCEGFFWPSPGKREKLLCTSQQWKLIWRSLCSSCKGWMREGERCSASNRSQSDYSVRWKCRFDFDHVFRLDHLIAVGRASRLRVEKRSSPR